MKNRQPKFHFWHEHWDFSLHDIPMILGSIQLPTKWVLQTLSQGLLTRTWRWPLTSI